MAYPNILSVTQRVNAQSTNITGDYPDLNDGDLLIAWIHARTQSASGFVDNQGFTEIMPMQLPSVGGGSLWLLAKVQSGAASAGSINWTFAASGSFSTTVEMIRVEAGTFDPETPIPDWEYATEGTADNTIESPGITTTRDESLVIFTGAQTAVECTYTLPTNDAVLWNFGWPTGLRGLFGFQINKATAGAVAAQTATMSTSTGTDAAASFIIQPVGAPSETMRPNTNTGGVATNLNSNTYDYTAIDDDPDSPDASWLTGTDPSAVQQTTSYFYADAQDGTTPSGFAGQLTNPANAVGSGETTQASTVSPTQNSDFGSLYSFDESAIASAIPSGNTVDAVEVDLRQWVSSASRGTAGVRPALPAGTAIATEKTLTTLIISAPTTGTPGTSNTFGESGDAWDTVPTRTQLVDSTFRIRVRIRRTASQAWTHNLDWVRLRATHTTPAQTVNTEIRAPLSDPTETLATGTDTGEIRLLVRKKGSGSDPQVKVELRNAAGSLLATPIANTTVTSTTGTVLSGKFNQSAVGSGTDVVAWIVGTGAAGGLVEVGAVEWNGQTSEGPPTHTGAAALAGSGAVAATGRATYLGAATLAGSGDLAGSGTRITSGTAALAGTGALAASGKRTTTGAAALAGSGTGAATGAHTGIGAAAIVGSGAIAAAGARGAVGSSALAGSGALSASGNVVTGPVTVTGAAALAGSGDLAGTGAHTGIGAASLAGSGAVAASGTKIAIGAASLAGTGDLAASGTRITSGAASLAGTGDLAGTGVAVIAGAAARAGSGALAASGTRIVSGAASLTGSGDLAGTGARIALGASALTGTGDLAAAGRFTSAWSEPVEETTQAGAATITGAAALTGSGDLAGSGVAVLAGAAVLAGSGDLAASGTRLAPAGSALTGTGDLAASGTRVVAGSASLAGAGSLTASSTGAVQGSASLAGSGTTAATARRITHGSVALVGSGALSGTGRLTAIGAAVLSGSGDLAAAGTILGVTSGAAALTGSGDLTATGVIPPPPGWPEASVSQESVPAILVGQA